MLGTPIPSSISTPRQIPLEAAGAKKNLCSRLPPGYDRPPTKITESRGNSPMLNMVTDSDDLSPSDTCNSAVTKRTAIKLTFSTSKQEIGIMENESD